LGANLINEKLGFISLIYVFLIGILLLRINDMCSSCSSEYSKENRWIFTLSAFAFGILGINEGIRVIITSRFPLRHLATYFEKVGFNLGSK